MYQLEMIRTALFGIAAALMFMSSAMAETVLDTVGSETGTTEPTVVSGTGTGTGGAGDGGTGGGTDDGTGTGTDDQASAFDQLSTGGQKHANSLFDAQQGGEGGGVLSLDDIALARQETGWGNVFKQMKEDGLVLEKNFGQIVSGQGKTDETIGNGADTGTDTETETATAGASTGTFAKPKSSGTFARPKRTKLVVTTAGGNRVVVGLKRSGPKSRSFAKGSGARKALKVSSRQMGRRTRITSGRGKISGLTAARGSHASLGTGRGGGGGKSFGGGGKGKSK